MPVRQGAPLNIPSRGSEVIALNVNTLGELNKFSGSASDYSRYADCTPREFG